MFKNASFYRPPPVASSEELIADEIKTFICLYDRGDRNKKIKKGTHGLGWRMPAAATK